MRKKLWIISLTLLLVSCGQASNVEKTVQVDLVMPDEIEDEIVVETPVTEQVKEEELEEVVIIEENKFEGVFKDITASEYDEDVKMIEFVDLINADDYNYNPEIILEVSNPESLYVLCNKLNHLPSDYVPSGLIEPEVRFSFDHADEKRQLRTGAAHALEKLFDNAESQGHILYALSGYRSYARQEAVYAHWVNKYGQEEADKFSARPGHSEHQTGMSMDITSESVGFDLVESFGEEAEGQWVEENAHRFGFIVRYPKDKTEITLYNYEPWHLRYVGIELANHLYENHMTLEEYYETLQ